jgi:hypothetical protein
MSSRSQLAAPSAHPARFVSLRLISSVILGVGMFLPLSATVAHAQSDEKEIITVVNKFFEGMRTRDTTLLRSTSLPSTVLQTAGSDAAFKPPTPIDQFIQRIGSGTGPGGNEVIKDPKVQSDGEMASLWAYFTFTRGGETAINHCGIDEFLLRKGPDGWKVFYVADTHRTQNCAPITK